MKQELTISEFATLMKTTKDTLIHYDAIDLFRPKSRQENGYRIYTPAQANTFIMIQAYREMGYSLAEIKMMLRDHASYENHKITLKKRIDQAIHDLEQTRFMLEYRDQFQKFLETNPMNKLFYDTWSMNQIYTHNTPVTDENFYTVLSKMQEAPETKTLLLSWMIGIRVKLQTETAQIFTPTNQKGEPHPIVALTIAADLDNLEKPIRLFLKQCNAHNVTITSDVYVLQVRDELTMGPQFESTILIFASY